ncbi:MAG: winged helix-turn-helix domain-containing protein [Burkholderiaceae bacterium]
MKDAPSFVGLAALLGDPSRATMLEALMGGQALTATELAEVARVTRQTASTHLGALVDAGMLVVRAQGRHRYFQLAAPDVAAMLESMMGVAQRTRVARHLPGPSDPALRRARRCYDHLAGELAVQAYDAFTRRGLIALASERSGDETLTLTPAGRAFFESIGFALETIAGARRPMCRPCLDWSARRHHLAGGLGRLLLEHCYERRWARPVADSRVVRFSEAGERSFRATFLD